MTMATLPLRAAGQTYVAGQTYFGRNNYIEYIAGDLPFIISAPHGGTLTPSELPDRTYGTFSTDTLTDRLARDVDPAMSSRFGHHPHVIICRVDRMKIDCNREIVEGAQGNALTEISWNDFQGFIATAKQTVMKQFGRGFYIDLHGHGHAIQQLELGYLLTAGQLGLGDATLNGSATYSSQSSIRELDQRSPASFAALLRGAGSIGGLLAAAGYPCVPSPAVPSPGSDPYFNGGYNTDRHGSSGGGTISAVQIETNYTGVRDTTANRVFFADKLAAALETFFADHFALNLYDGLPTISAIADRTINQDSATGSIAFTIGDAETAPASLSLSAVSSMPSLVPAANIVFSGSGSSRTVKVTPAPGQAGSTLITLMVIDANGGMDSEDFTLRVNARPTIASIADQTIGVNTATGPLPFTVGDLETSAASLAVSASSSNLTLVPNANVLLGGSGASRTVAITPVANRIGAATITVSVSDGALTASAAFLLTVTATPSQSWRLAHFGIANATGVAADLADPEKDGLVNLLEFALASDPNAASPTALPIAARQGANLTLTYTRNKSALADGVLFAVEIAPAPGGTWSGAGVTETIVSDNGTVQQVKATVASGAPSARFLHLKITRP